MFFCLLNVKARRPICNGPKVKAMKEIHLKTTSLFTLVHSILDLEPDCEAISQDTLSSNNGGLLTECSRALLNYLCSQRFVVICSSIPKIIFKSTGFSRIFCVHTSTLRKGCDKYPVISQSRMERCPRGLPNLCLSSTSSDSSSSFLCFSPNPGMHRIPSNLNKWSNFHFSK